MHTRNLRILIAVASATEARTLVPLARSLSDRAVRVDVVDLGPIGVANAADALPSDIPRLRLRPWSWPSARGLLRRFSPDAVVLGNDNLYFNRILVRTSRRVGVPTVLVQEGATWHTPIEELTRGLGAALRNPGRALFHVSSHLANGDLDGLFKRVASVATGRPTRMPGYGFGGAHLFCVANRRIARAFLEAGCQSRIEATGIPDLVAEPPPDQSKAKFDVVYLAAPLTGAGLCSESDYRAFVHTMIGRIYEALPSTRVGIKIHPNWEDEGTYAWLRGEFPEVAVMKERDRPQVIAAGRAFVGFGSTLTLDAWYAGRTALCVTDAIAGSQLQATDVYRLAHDHGAVVSFFADSTDELRSKLARPQQALVETVRRDYGLSVGTRAARRIADRVVDLATAKDPQRPISTPVSSTRT